MFSYVYLVFFQHLWINWRVSAYNRSRFSLGSRWVFRPIKCLCPCLHCIFLPINNLIVRPFFLWMFSSDVVCLSIEHFPWCLPGKHKIVYAPQVAFELMEKFTKSSACFQHLSAFLPPLRFYHWFIVLCRALFTFTMNPSSTEMMSWLLFSGEIWGKQGTQEGVRMKKLPLVLVV